MKVLYFIMIFFLAESSILASGNDVGNGGGVWVCQAGSPMKIIGIHLVDLFEAKEEFKLNIPELTHEINYRDIVKLKEMTLFRANPELFNTLIPYIDTVFNSLVFVNAELKIIDDSLFRLVPEQASCPNGEIHYNQIANYTDYGKILIQNDLWNHHEFTELEKAALILHEAIYKYARENLTELNSVRSRQAVGYLFSDLSDAEIGLKITEVFDSSGSNSNFNNGKQKYFKVDSHYLLKGSGNLITPDSLLILDKLSEGWKVQLSGNETYTGLQGPVQFTYSRKIGNNTWMGDFLIKVMLKNGKICQFTASSQVTFSQYEKTEPTKGSYARILLTWPAPGIAYIENCGEFRLSTYERIIPLGI